MLREVADAGVFVSTHPDVITKLGTKDVLFETREMGWGSDVHRLDNLEQLRLELGYRLAAGAIRVLKQRRGHSGIGVWRVQRASRDPGFGARSLVRARHAARDSAEVTLSFDEFVARMAPYFEAGGHMSTRRGAAVDRRHGALLPRAGPGGGLRGASGERASPSRARERFGRATEASQRGCTTRPPFPHLARPEARLETEWVPELQRTLDIG